MDDGQENIQARVGKAGVTHLGDCVADDDGPMRMRRGGRLAHGADCVECASGHLDEEAATVVRQEYGADHHRGEEALVRHFAARNNAVEHLLRREGKKGE